MLTPVVGGTGRSTLPVGSAATTLAAADSALASAAAALLLLLAWLLLLLLLLLATGHAFRTAWPPGTACWARPLLVAGGAKLPAAGGDAARFSLEKRSGRGEPPSAGLPHGASQEAQAAAAGAGGASPGADPEMSAAATAVARVACGRWTSLISGGAQLAGTETGAAGPPRAGPPREVVGRSGVACGRCTLVAPSFSE